MQRARAREPADYRTRRSFGGCLLELHRWDEGLASLRSAIEFVPRCYPMARKVVATSGHGRFSLKPNSAAGLLQRAKRA